MSDEYRSLTWFNISSPMWIVGRWRGRQVTLRLWNLFNRESTDGHWWGFGLVQIGKRHLFWLGDQGRGIRVLFGFLGRTD